MSDGGYRVLVVSGRLLVAQAIKGLLEAEAGIESIDLAVSLYEAFDLARMRSPDAIVLDLPVGSEWLIDRPITIDGRPIKTIVLQQENGHSRLYILSPSKPASLRNLKKAIMQDAVTAQIEQEESPEPQDYSQPISLMTARASGPRSSRISASNSSV